ncbi:MAG: class I SAM-dependent methyltransferase [Rubrivivax sp.]
MNQSEQSHLNPPPRNTGTDAAWRELHRRATEPYRAAGKFSWHFARGKLGLDPVFRSLLERGEARGGRVVDIGCGQGLFSSLLQSCGDMAHEGRWPAGWPAAPRATAYTGIELMPKDMRRAQTSVGGLAIAPRFVCGNMCTTPLPACDLVVILDVLHYVDHAAQNDVLQRVQAALAPSRGRLLLRVGDMDDASGFRASQWVDKVVTLVRGHRVPPTWGRSLPQWTAKLRELGFASVRSLPMSQGTPFANVLLIADLA